MGLALRGSERRQRRLLLYNDVDDVIAVRPAIDGFGSASMSADRTRLPTAATPRTRASCCATRASPTITQGWLGGCEGCAIEYNQFENNGFVREVLLHNIYAGGEPTACASSATSCTAIGDRQRLCSASRWWCTACANLLIENNVVREDLGAVDSAAGASPSTPATTNRRRSRPHDPRQHGDQRRQRRHRRERVPELPDREQRGGPRADVRDDRDRRARSRRASQRRRAGAVKVRNNTIYIGKGPPAPASGSAERATATRLPATACTTAAPQADWSCFDFDLPDASYAALDDNLCHAGPGAPAVGARPRRSGPVPERTRKAAATRRRSTRYHSVTPGSTTCAPTDAPTPLIDAGDPQAQLAPPRSTDQAATPSRTSAPTSGGSVVNARRRWGASIVRRRSSALRTRGLRRTGGGAARRRGVRPVAVGRLVRRLR